MSGQAAIISTATSAPVTVTATQRSPPPTVGGPSPVISAATHPPRPALSWAGQDTGGENGAQTVGHGGRWGFCDGCQRPLGRLAPGKPKRYCSAECRASVAAARCAKPCEVCGAPCRSPVNHTCGHACAKIWRRSHGAAYSEEQTAKIGALWDAGLGFRAIAAQLGVSKHAIAGFRKRHLADRPLRAPNPPLPAVKPGRLVLVCQPEGSDRRQPGRYCSAHPEIRWHPRDWRCQAAA